MAKSSGQGLPWEIWGITTPSLTMTTGPKAQPRCHQLQATLGGLWTFCPITCREEGSAKVTVMVLNAITKWKAAMSCTAPTGLGLAPTATFMTYKPLLVELALLCAVTCGKSFAVAATIFNPLQRCLWVSGVGWEQWVQGPRPDGGLILLVSAGSGDTGGLRKSGGAGEGR